MNSTSVTKETSAAASTVASTVSSAGKPAEQSTAPAVQAGDGQVQQIGDGQVQNHKRDLPQTCKTGHDLALTLSDSMLSDSHGRVGAIVANRQFQFDGPPPQAGTIYAAGWSISSGLLALGDQTTFYQCKSGDFSNLYDESIGGQCSPVELVIEQLVDC